MQIPKDLQDRDDLTLGQVVEIVKARTRIGTCTKRIATLEVRIEEYEQEIKDLTPVAQFPDDK